MDGLTLEKMMVKWESMMVMWAVKDVSSYLDYFMLE